jgi:CheY-like chemotaxis protein
MTVATEKPLFILVDDDPINNSISRLTIINTISDAEIAVFTDPKMGLRFLTEGFVEPPVKSAVLLLNLNMPFMSGWEFLKQFADLAIDTQKRIRIYILSSSLDPIDRKRSEGIESVKGFLNKPLSSEMIVNL